MRWIARHSQIVRPAIVIYHLDLSHVGVIHRLFDLVFVAVFGMYYFLKYNKLIIR